MGLQRVCWLACSLTCLVPCSYASRREQPSVGTLRLFADATGSISMKTESIVQSENTSMNVSESAPKLKKIKEAMSSEMQDKCNQFRSFIISVNSEFVTFDEKHVLSMMVNAIHSVEHLPELKSWEKAQQLLGIEPNSWESVSARLTMLKIDILIYACQECSRNEKTPEILAKNLGKFFKFDVKKQSYKKSTCTKPKQLKWSYFEIAALLRKDTECPVERISIASTIAAYGNKGGAMIHVKTAASQNIAFVATHLDADTESNRLKSINKILKRLKIGHTLGLFSNGPEFDHEYIFGDLNYRLLAPSGLKSARLTEWFPDEATHCLNCVSGVLNGGLNGSLSSCIGGEVGKRCQWCYLEDSMDQGKCVTQQSNCPQEKKTKAMTFSACRKPKVTGDSYKKLFSMMMAERSKVPPVSMYESVRHLDTLWNNRYVWVKNHFYIPQYSVDVPPTYKVAYDKSSNITVQSENWVTFQSLLEKEPTGLVEAPLLDAVDAVYDKKTKTKLCAYHHVNPNQMISLDQHRRTGDEECMDFGWLDRLVIRDKGTTVNEDGQNAGPASTIIKMYRNLKMQKDFGFGDHSPLFILLEST